MKGEGELPFVMRVYRSGGTFSVRNGKGKGSDLDVEPPYVEYPPGIRTCLKRALSDIQMTDP